MSVLVAIAILPRTCALIAGDTTAIMNHKNPNVAPMMNIMCQSFCSLSSVCSPLARCAFNIKDTPWATRERAHTQTSDIAAGPKSEEPAAGQGLRCATTARCSGSTSGSRMPRNKWFIFWAESTLVKMSATLSAVSTLFSKMPHCER